MAKRLTGQNPLAYIGVEPLTPPNSIATVRNPESTDFKGFNVGDFWVNTATNQSWILSSKTNTSGTWSEIASSSGGGAENFPTDMGTAVALASTLDVLGGSLITTDALVPNTITISLDNGTDGQVIIGGGSAPAWANITSSGSTITITEGPNTLNLEADTSQFADSYPTDSGTAQPMGGELNIIGGGNLNTEGSSNTVTINITNGANGQLLIGGGSDAQWTNLTSVGGTITITNGPNSINLESTTDGTNTFTTDSGTATQSLNNIDIVGANVISTSGAGDTVTISLDNGTNGQLLIGGGASAAWANLTSMGGTVVITNGANSINLEATGGGDTGASTFHTDSGDALQSMGEITMAGGDLITTSGAGSTVTYDLVNGTNGQVIIGGGGAPAWATLTSMGGTITFAAGANTLNLEANTGGDSGASEFITDSGTAVQVAGELNVVGGTNINTSGASNTVTISLNDDVDIPGVLDVQTEAHLPTTQISGAFLLSSQPVGVLRTTGVLSQVTASNGTNGEILIGGGSQPEWANITSGDGSVTITNGANTIDLSVTGGGGGGSIITQFTTSGTWTKSAGTNFVTVLGWHGGGGGAAGGKGGASTAGGGGGGAQGSAFCFTVPAIFCGATEPVVVGLGGTGGAPQTVSNSLGADGTDGGVSSFGNIIMPQLASRGLGQALQAFVGGQAGQLFNSDNALFTGGSNGPVAVAVSGGPITSTVQTSRSGGQGGQQANGSAGSNVGGLTIGAGNWYRYKLVIGTAGGGGGGVGFSGGVGGTFRNFEDTGNLYTPAAAGANGMDRPTSGGIVMGGFGGGGGNGHNTTPQNGGNGGFPGGGGGGGGAVSNAGAQSGAGGDGGDGLVIVIEW